MDFDQFKIQVVDEMRERFPDLDIGIQAVSKLLYRSGCQPCRQ